MNKTAERIGRLQASGDSLQYVRLRAPHRGGETLDIPAADEVKSLFEKNLAGRATNASTWSSKVFDVDHWQQVARREAVALAVAYSRRYLPEATPLEERSNVEDRPILFAGHQPRLFHPGVWYKNFRLFYVAKQFKATSINMVVDNDLAVSSLIKLPTFEASVGGSPHVRTSFVAVDDPGPAVPFEMLGVQNEQLFRSFADRVADQISPIVERPLVKELWPQVLVAMDSLGTRSAGAVLAAGRHRLEWASGIRNLEVPVSHLASTTSFAALAACVIENVETFHAVYNGVLKRYRKLHGIKSSAHPVPALSVDEQWREAPFWIWTADEHRRRPLMVRHSGNEIQLSNSKSTLATVPRLQLAEWIGEQARSVLSGEPKFFIRPRALITTMYSRLLASDLFVHGIGGAKYDQVTDQIIAEFFGGQAGKYLTSTATFRLPSAGIEEISPADIVEQRTLIRQMRFHPEKFIERPSAEAAKLMSTKEQAISDTSERNRRARHDAIESANDGLQSYIANEKKAASARLKMLEGRLSDSQIIHSREYSICLHDVGLIERLKSAANK